MGDSDHERFFNAIPAMYLVYDLDWTIVAVTDATLGDSLRREDVVWRNQSDVFPDPDLPGGPEGSGRDAMEAALQRVVDERVGHEMPVTRFDSAGPDGELDEHLFRPVNEPVLDSGGTVTHVIHGVVDVAEAQEADRRPGKGESSLR